MARTSLKALFTGRKRVYCLFIVEFDTPGMGHILAAAGADFAFLDMEHSGFGIDSIKRALRYYEAADMPTLVRPPSKTYDHIARVLDAGAEGVCLPLVDSAAEAAEIVSYVKYPPAGGRGVGQQMMHDRFLPGEPAAKLRAANRKTVVVLQIESAGGAVEVDKIAAVKGIDALWVGHYDLSVSLGIPGQFDHPDYLDVIRRTARACERNGLSLGVVAGSVETGLEHMAMGFNVIGYSTDAWILRDGLRAGIEGLRAGEKKLDRRGRARKGRKT